MRRSSANAARRRLEDAVTALLRRAVNYTGVASSNYYDTPELLEAAREYARAFRRVETLRRA